MTTTTTTSVMTCDIYTFSEILVLLVLFLLFIYARSSDLSVHYTVLVLSPSHDVKFFLERELLRLDGLVRVLFLPGVPSELSSDMTFLALTPQNILIRHESLEADWPPRVDPSRADPDLGPEAITEAVREARTRVHEHAGRVNAAHECTASRGRLCDDAIGVVRAVLVDVRHGGCEGGHRAHGQREREVLGREGFWWGWQHVRLEVGVIVARRFGGWGRSECGERWFVAEELYVGCEKRFRYVGPDRLEQALVD